MQVEADKVAARGWKRGGAAGGGHAFEYFDGVRADAHQLLVHSARTSRHGVAVRYAGSCEERSDDTVEGHTVRAG